MIIAYKQLWDRLREFIEGRPTWEAHDLLLTMETLEKDRQMTIDTLNRLSATGTWKEKGGEKGDDLCNQVPTLSVDER